MAAGAVLWTGVRDGELLMPTQRLLAQGREAAERLMTDTAELRRATDEMVTDPETGEVKPGVAVVATVKCKVASNAPTSTTPEAGEHRYTVEQLRLHMPLGSPALAGDEAVITESEINPDNVGIAFRLSELNRGTHRTAQRWSVEVLTR